MDWALLITAITPALIGAIKKYLPGIMGKVPTVLIPLAAPLIGIGIDYLGSLTVGGSAGTLNAALYGALGVWAREVLDQVKQATAKPA